MQFGKLQYYVKDVLRYVMYYALLQLIHKQSKISNLTDFCSSIKRGDECCSPFDCSWVVWLCQIKLDPTQRRIYIWLKGSCSEGYFKINNRNSCYYCRLPPPTSPALMFTTNHWSEKCSLEVIWNVTRLALWLNTHFKNDLCSLLTFFVKIMLSSQNYSFYDN